MAGVPRTLLDVVRLSTTYLAEHGSGSARLDAELVCAHALGLRRLDCYLQYDRPLDDAELSAVRELVRRRGRGEPVAHITGTREFHSRAFCVTPDVLVPRPETETLVERALAVLRERGEARRLRVADLGTGSGCIAVTLAAELPGVDVVASDISPAAIDIARANASAHGVAVTFVECAWADALDGRFDLAVSNPPYVTAAELAATAADVRDFEPHGALLGGEDGLDAYRALLESVRLNAGVDRLLLEIDPRRAVAVEDLIASEFPAATTSVIPDLAGRARVVDASLA